jgi:membrane-associated phospholipid phosphatase
MTALLSLDSIWLRLVAVCAALGLWFFTQRLIGQRTLPQGEPYDHLHVLTASTNAWLNAHPKAANGLLIVTSLLIDAMTLFVLARALFGDSFLPFWGLFGLFALRQLSQATVALPPPPGIIWRHPGFPSLFVTYEVGNDLFFSGHTALAIYGAVQLAALGIPALTVAAIIVAVLEMAAVIALGAHWTMDVLTGLLAALLAGVLVSKG